MIKNQSGFSLVEITIGTALMMMAGLVASSLLVESSRFSVSIQNENSRAQIIQATIYHAGNPKAIEASLRNVFSCFNTGDSCSANSTPVAFGLLMHRRSAALTGAQREINSITSAGDTGLPVGEAFFTDAGVRCQANSDIRDGEKCPLHVVTRYQLSCGSSTKNQCPGSQAVLQITYDIAPNTLGVSRPPRNDQVFMAITGQTSLKIRDLYTTSQDPNIDVYDKDLSQTDSLGSRQCGEKEILVGVDAGGNMICRAVESSCERGEIFIGYDKETDGRLKAVCRNIKCPMGEIFQGFNATTGNPVCRKLNPNNTACEPFSGASNSPNYSPTQFMTGFNVTSGEPICGQVTCAPGEISACWRDGNVQCVNTNFIPSCSGCQLPPDATGTRGRFYNSGNVGSSFEGMPFISEWVNGEPVEGYRQTYHDWGSSAYSTDPLIAPISDRVGAGTLDGNCQPEAGGGNMTVTHSWRVMTGTSVYRWPTPPPTNFSPLYPDNTILYDWSGGGSETCTLSLNGSQVTANCPTPDSGNDSCSETTSGITGARGCDSYSNWQIRASCNYSYRKPSRKCS